jgi:hypothetical protein
MLPALRSRIVPSPDSPEQQRRNEIPLQIQALDPPLIDASTKRALFAAGFPGVALSIYVCLGAMGRFPIFLGRPSQGFFPTKVKLTARRTEICSDLD